MKRKEKPSREGNQVAGQRIAHDDAYSAYKMFYLLFAIRDDKFIESWEQKTRMHSFKNKNKQTIERVADAKIKSWWLFTRMAATSVTAKKTAATNESENKLLQFIYTRAHPHNKQTNNLDAARKKPDFNGLSWVNCFFFFNVSKYPLLVTHSRMLFCMK